MSDPNEWQKSGDHRRAGPAAGEPAPRRSEDDREHHPHLTQGQVERIEEEVREDVARSPAISDS